MLSSAATFSFFLSIGSVRSTSHHILLIFSPFALFFAVLLVRLNEQVIRNDADIPPQLLAAQQGYAHMYPSIASRREGAQTVQARWIAAAALAGSSKPN